MFWVIRSIASLMRASGLIVFGFGLMTSAAVRPVRSREKARRTSPSVTIPASVRSSFVTTVAPLRPSVMAETTSAKVAVSGTVAGAGGRSPIQSRTLCRLMPSLPPG